MDLISLLTIVLSNAALFLWNRSESRNDIRHLDAKLDANRNETNSLIQAIQYEIKDFHGRLCAIEEKNKRGN